MLPGIVIGLSENVHDPKGFLLAPITEELRFVTLIIVINIKYACM